jgi:hypothetical protein
MEPAARACRALGENTWSRSPRSGSRGSCVPTAIGLPTAPVPDDVPKLPSDPGWTVMFVGFWLFAQQICLLHDLYEEPTTRRFDELFNDCGRWRSCRRSSR